MRRASSGRWTVALAIARLTQKRASFDDAAQCIWRSGWVLTAWSGGVNTSDPGMSISSGGFGVPGGTCFCNSSQSTGFSAVATYPVASTNVRNCALVTGRLIHPETLDLDATRRSLVGHRIGIVRAHRECTARDPAHALGWGRA